MAKHYYEQVYDVVIQIPEGRVSTYGHIADYLALGSARMVGWALKQLTAGSGVPAHRVLNHKGELSGRAAFPSPSFMQEMLEAEGVVIKNYRVQDFETVLWIPSEQLENF